jgi:hypothetical protein
MIPKSFDTFEIPVFCTIARHTADSLENIATGRALSSDEREYLSGEVLSRLEGYHTKLWSSIDAQFQAPPEHPEWDVALDPVQPHYRCLALFALPQLDTTSPDAMRAALRRTTDAIQRLPNITPDDARDLLPYLRRIALYGEYLRH